MDFKVDGRDFDSQRSQSESELAALRVTPATQRDILQNGCVKLHLSQCHICIAPPDTTISQKKTFLQIRLNSVVSIRNDNFS